MWPSADKEVQV